MRSINLRLSYWRFSKCFQGGELYYSSESVDRTVPNLERTELHHRCINPKLWYRYVASPFKDEWNNVVDKYAVREVPLRRPSTRHLNHCWIFSRQHAGKQKTRSRKADFCWHCSIRPTSKVTTVQWHSDIWMLLIWCCIFKIVKCFPRRQQYDVLPLLSL